MNGFKSIATRYGLSPVIVESVDRVIRASKFINYVLLYQMRQNKHVDKIVNPWIEPTNKTILK